MSCTSEETTVCIKCNKEEKDLRKVIECEYCHRSEHFKCKNVIGNAIRKLREQQYFCSLECQELFQRISFGSAMENQVLKEVRTVLAEVRETREEMRAVKTTVADMEKFQCFLSDKLDSVLDEIKSMKSEHSGFKTDINHLMGKQQETSSKLENLELEVDRLQRDALSKNAIILGLPMVRDEILPDVVRKIAAAVGYELPQDAVCDAKRLLPNDSSAKDKSAVPIKVCFSDQRYKEELLHRKKMHGQLLAAQVDPIYTGTARRITLRDELTTHGVQLLKDARETQEVVGCKYVWPGRNGAILVKKTDNSKTEIIRSQQDLQQLVKKYAKRQLDQSGSDSSLMESTRMEQSPKRRQ